MTEDMSTHSKSPMDSNSIQPLYRLTSATTSAGVGVPLQLCASPSTYASASVSSFRRAVEKALSNGFSPEFPPISTAHSLIQKFKLPVIEFKIDSHQMKVESSFKSAITPSIPSTSTSTSLQQLSIGEQAVIICLFAGESNERVYHTSVKCTPDALPPLIQLNDIVQSVLGQHEKQAVTRNEKLRFFVEERTLARGVSESIFSPLTSDNKKLPIELGATSLFVVVANASDPRATNPLFLCPLELKTRLKISAQSQSETSVDSSAAKVPKIQSHQKSHEILHSSLLVPMQTVVENFFPAVTCSSSSSVLAQSQEPLSHEFEEAVEVLSEDSEWTLI